MDEVDVQGSETGIRFNGHCKLGHRVEIVLLSTPVIFTSPESHCLTDQGQRHLIVFTPLCSCWLGGEADIIKFSIELLQLPVGNLNLPRINEKESRV